MSGSTSRSSRVPSPRQIEQAMSDAMRAIAELGDQEDGRLLQATIEGQSDVYELLDRLAEHAVADSKLADLAADRARRIELRATRARTIILQILETLGLDKVERALVTASLAYHRKATVTDETILPEAYIRRAPDMTALRRDMLLGNDIPGAVLGNPMPRLTLLTK